jgi:hypothetical protein
MQICSLFIIGLTLVFHIYFSDGRPSNDHRRASGYLSHLRRGRCEYGVEYGIEYLPCFIHMQIHFEGTIERIPWTKMLKDHFQDLEVISNLVYKNYVAYILAQSNFSNS